MSNLPALPSEQDEDRATSEAKAIRCLMGSLAKQGSLRMSQATTGEWTLSPSNELTAGEMRGALDALDRELEGGPKQKIAMAITELLGATDRPPQLSDAAAAVRTAALTQMAWEYPIDVIQAACRQWRRVPNYGRWWPAEQDLRVHCEEFVKSRKNLREQAARLLATLSAREEHGTRDRGRSLHPYGRTREFVDRVREHPHLGQPFVRSYLSDMTCDFTDDVIFVAYSTQAERIPQRCAAILKDFPGLKIIHDRQTTERCNRDQDAMGNTWKAPDSKPRKQWGKGT